jgi:hypothetical protein
MGIISDGVSRMRELQRRSVDWASHEDLAHIEYQLISTEFGCESRALDVDMKTLRSKWANAIRKFIATYPRSSDAPEAVFELAGTAETEGNSMEAIKWYSRLRRDFPTHFRSQMAEGAMWRLTSIGRTMDLRDREFTGKIDASTLDIGVGLVVFWTTDTFSRDGLARVAKMSSASNTRPIQVVGVNLDSNPRQLDDWLQENRWPWSLVRQPEGFMSRLAIRYGIMELPTIFLVDSKARVVWYGVGVANCERNFARLFPPVEVGGRVTDGPSSGHTNEKDE